MYCTIAAALYTPIQMRNHRNQYLILSENIIHLHAYRQTWCNIMFTVSNVVVLSIIGPIPSSTPKVATLYVRCMIVVCNIHTVHQSCAIFVHDITTALQKKKV